MGMDRVDIQDQDQAIRHLRSLGLQVNEDVVRSVVTAIHKDEPTYRFWNEDKAGKRLCAKGTVDKIKRLYKQGLFRSYIDYLDLDRLLEHKNGDGVPSLVMTGIQSLDELTGGMNPRDLLILGGPPAIGKSIFTLNVVINVA
jgi:hypothetical protein